MTTHALMELAEHIALLTKVRDASKANGGVRSIDFAKESGDAFIAALSAAIEALQLRTAASEGGEEPAFFVPDALVKTCKMLHPAVKLHRVTVATERTETHTVPLYTHPPEVARDAEQWPARFGCDGPEGSFWTDDSALANKLIASTYDRDEWTVTDTQQAAISGAAGVSHGS